MTGHLAGIARRPARRAPMEALRRVRVSVEGGLEGDHKGPKHPDRRVTLMSLESWLAALAELPSEAFDLPWTTRRANLLVEGVGLPRAAGGIVSIGPVRLEITQQTSPCARMEEAQPGLLRALHPEWRGGVCARVLEGGEIALGDPVRILYAPVERVRALPG